MKKGAGDDPFSDEEQDDDTEAAPDVASSPSETQPRDEVSQPTPSPDIGEEPRETPQQLQAPDDLPFLARRKLKNESVKSGRDQVPFFLRTEVREEERELMRALEDELDRDVNKTDMREAAYVFAQRHPDGVAEILREWGIDYLE